MARMRSASASNSDRPGRDARVRSVRSSRSRGTPFRCARCLSPATHGSIQIAHGDRAPFSSGRRPARPVLGPDQPDLPLAEVGRPFRVPTCPQPALRLRVGLVVRPPRTVVPGTPRQRATDDLFDLDERQRAAVTLLCRQVFAEALIFSHHDILTSAYWDDMFWDDSDRGSAEPSRPGHVDRFKLSVHADYTCTLVVLYSFPVNAGPRPTRAKGRRGKNESRSRACGGSGRRGEDCHRVGCRPAGERVPLAGPAAGARASGHRRSAVAPAVRPRGGC